MKHFYHSIKLAIVVLLGFTSKMIIAQSACVTPVITSIGNDGPVCEGGTLRLHAEGTVGGVSTGSVRMAGIGANAGNREFDVLFASGDRPGSIARITTDQFNAIAAAKTKRHSTLFAG